MQESLYKARRETLLNQIDEGVIILSAATLQTRSNDTEYPFRQDSNFYYMSGFLEDNSYMVLSKKDGISKTYFFVQKKEPEMELWIGKRLGVEEAKECFSFDEIYSSDTFFEKLEELLSGVENIYCDLFENDDLFMKIKSISKKVKKNRNVKISPSSFKNITDIIEKMRLIKGSEEVNLIEKALEITKEAHHNAMKKIKPSMLEYELQAEYEYTFKRKGAYSDAYTTIIAGGDNANTLHYIKNSDILKDGELVLIDAGCEYQMYASDITRTFPVNGKFSDAQREVYEMVLGVQLKVIEHIKPGITKSELQHYSEKLLTEGMIRLGILKGSVGKLLDDKSFKKYYPHGIGHWLGLDVHDQAPYFDENAEEIIFAEGMILTIEPGIYLPLNDNDIPQQYRGVGIRIEDDILVTADGHRNLSEKIVKSVKEIENLMKYS